MGIKSFLKKLYYVPSATINISARKNMERLNLFLMDLKEPSLLNIGSGERFIGGEKLDIKKLRTFINMDIFPFRGVNALGDAHNLPFKNEVFDGVICQAVLEHVENPFRVVKEIYRVLRKDGILYVEVPFIQGYHPSPKDLYRFTLEGLEKLLSCFSKIDSGICVGPCSTFSLISREFLTELLTGFGKLRFLRTFAFFFGSWLTFPVKYIDLLISKNSSNYKIASGFYYFGKKE
jgi:SAM-dependent methyltransferase